MKKTTLYWALTIISIMTLNISNIISSKQLQLPFGLTAAAGIITIPIVYVVNDCMVEVFGFKKGMKTALVSYGTNLFAVACFTLAIILPHTALYADQDAFALILGNAPRFLLASGASFLVGSLFNAAIMQAMHNQSGDKHLFARCFTSTVAGEIADKSIYMAIAFSGVLPWYAIGTNIVSAALLAILYESIVYPLATAHIIKWAKNLVD